MYLSYLQRAYSPTQWQIARAQTVRVDVTSVLEPGMRVRVKRTINNVTGLFQCTVDARRQMAFPPTPTGAATAGDTNNSKYTKVDVTDRDSGGDDDGEGSAASAGDGDIDEDDSDDGEAQYCYDITLGSGKKMEKVPRSLLRL